MGGGNVQLLHGGPGVLVVCILDLPSSILDVIAGISAGQQRWALHCSCRAMWRGINLVEASNVKLVSECAVFQTTIQRCLSALHVVTGKQFFNVMYQDYAADNFHIQLEEFECAALDAWQLQVEFYRDVPQQPDLCMFKVLRLAGEYRVTLEADDANSASAETGVRYLRGRWVFYPTCGGGYWDASYGLLSLNLGQCWGGCGSGVSISQCTVQPLEFVRCVWEQLAMQVG